MRFRHQALVLAAAALAMPALSLAQEPALEASVEGAAANRPRWEAGLATVGGRVADYPGSDQSRVRGIVAPVFVYRGPFLRVEQGGIRGRFVNTSDFEFDLSATAAFNARNNGARQGMPSLDYLFGVGPQLVYKGLRDLPGSPTVRLKVRAMFSTDFRGIDDRGFTIDPEVRWKTRPFKGSPATLTLSLQPTWASRSLHEYFYEVEPGQATVTRPAYEARAGYLGTEMGLNLMRPQGREIVWFVGVHGMSLHGSANRASPLLRSSTDVGVLAGLVWTPWQSSARATD